MPATNKPQAKRSARNKTKRVKRVGASTIRAALLRELGGLPPSLDDTYTPSGCDNETFGVGLGCKRILDPTVQTILVSKGDRIVFQYGDITYNRDYIASCRKSILAILYGMYRIDIHKTLAELGIDDKQGLSKTEKKATIKDLLAARSGIYHPASNEGDDTDKPPRHSKKPGSYFVYNNWDFNALGTIFQQETGISIYNALAMLGAKIGFQDYDLEYNNKRYAEDLKYMTTQKSIHPPYHMYLSARDMLKIGKLMMNKGKYRGKQIVPRAWVEEITRVHTPKNETQNYDMGYGYMWWVFDGYTVGCKILLHPNSTPIDSLSHPSVYDKSSLCGTPDDLVYGGYAALGANGQSIIVAPKIDLIVVTKNYMPHMSVLDVILKAYM